MALSQEAKDRLIIALTSRPVGKEVAAAIDSLYAVAPASSIAALGALAPVGAVDVADAGPANVALSADVDARIASLQAKIDAVIAALKAASLMSP